MDNYYELFKSNLQGFKEIGGDSQFVALCHHHQDSKHSFSGNYGSGLWNCKACGVKGNAYQFAEQMNIPNPHQFINDDNVPFVSSVPPKPTISIDQINQQFEEHQNRLKKNMELWLKCWDMELIDKMGGGVDANNNWVFGYYDSSNNLVGFKVHKLCTKGMGKCHWYHPNQIAQFKGDKPLYIVEGEKDVLTLISHQFQAITGTTGAMAIPKGEDGRYDVGFLGIFSIIYICYDNDDSGYNGANRLADEILKEHPNLNIKILQWDTDLPEHFDITDAFLKDRDGTDFFNGLTNAKQVIHKPNKIGGLKLITGLNATTMEVEPKRQIIEYLIPEKSQIILGGTTGANKSILAMLLGMSLANNELEFLGFKINVKGQKVLYFDSECGEDVLVERYQKLQKNFKWEGDSRFTLLTKDTESDKIYDDIENAMKQVKPDILFIDCLYNTTDGADISKNHNIFPITKRISQLRDAYNCTIVSIHHMNKGGHQEGLQKDRMAGGSSLQNWAEHIVLMTRTNETGTRLMKIDKSRHIDYPECIYKLNWDSQAFNISNEGICTDWKHLLLTDAKKIKWENALEQMEDTFGTGEFQKAVAEGGDASDRTARNWLREMEKMQVIEKVEYGTWKKGLKLIKE